jgi:hypothetical protein
VTVAYNHERAIRLLGMQILQHPGHLWIPGKSLLHQARSLVQKDQIRSPPKYGPQTPRLLLGAVMVGKERVANLGRLRTNPTNPTQAQPVPLHDLSVKKSQPWLQAKVARSSTEVIVIPRHPDHPAKVISKGAPD